MKPSSQKKTKIRYRRLCATRLSHERPPLQFPCSTPTIPTLRPLSFSLIRRIRPYRCGWDFHNRRIVRGVVPLLPCQTCAFRLSGDAQVLRGGRSSRRGRGRPFDGLGRLDGSRGGGAWSGGILVFWDEDAADDGVLSLGPHHLLHYVFETCAFAARAFCGSELGGWQVLGHQVPAGVDALDRTLGPDMSHGCLLDASLTFLDFDLLGYWGRGVFFRGRC